MAFQVMLSSTSPGETLEVVAHHDDDDVRRECDGPPHRSDVEGRSGRPSSAKKSKGVLCIMERIAVPLVVPCGEAAGDALLGESSVRMQLCIVVFFHLHV